MKMKRVEFVAPVMLAGKTRNGILATECREELVFDVKTIEIRMKGTAEVVLVPLHNIKFIVMAEPGAEKPPVVEPEPAPVPPAEPIDDEVVFEKDARGEIVERRKPKQR
jgi:hypothetical protein